MKEILPLLLMFGECCDEYYCDFIYSDHISNIYNYTIQQLPNHGKVLLIRRGMWEMINN